MGTGFGKYVVMLYTAGMAAFFFSCSEDRPEVSVNEVITADTFNQQEDYLRKSFEEKPIILAGRVTDLADTPLINAKIEVENLFTFTDDQGQFQFENLPRKNSLITISAEGYKEETLCVRLMQSLSVDQYNFGTISMQSNPGDSVRFLFGGDTSFGRRFLDPDETTGRDSMPPNNPNALIQVSDPLPGSKAVLQFVRPFFQAADFSVVNLESPVIVYPETPHLEKDFAYFSFPESLPALTWLGVDYVSLGNNHVYDYLEKGLTETLQHLEDYSIPFSGAGTNSELAFHPYRTTIKGTPYSFLSATSIAGEKHSISYVASETKGGAADLRKTSEISNLIQSETQEGYIPILQLHGGTEYSYQPEGYISDRFDMVSMNHSALTLSHHPHVAQGVGRFNDVITLMGLGNFAFDQDRHETFLSILARVDMQGSEVEAVRLIPIYLEDYRPRPICGDLASLFIRRLGEHSHDFGMLVYPYLNQGRVSLTPDDYQVLDRTELLNITIPASGKAIIDLRNFKNADESLLGYASANSSIELGFQTGKDLMLYGDFEDWDQDSDTFEALRWDLSLESSDISLTQKYAGLSSAMSTRYSSHTSDSVIAFRNRVRVWGDELNLPEKDLTFWGYMKVDGAGPIKVVTRYYSSFDDLEYGEEEVYNSTGGFKDWMPISGEIHMPEDLPSLDEKPSLNPRALRVFIHQTPPVVGKGFAFFDNIAIISWNKSVASDQGEDVSTPNTSDFLRISGAPGAYAIQLKFRSFQPAAQP